MITVIGGTGTTGKYVVRELQDRGAEFRCIVRDEASGREKLGDGVALVKGDISDSSTIEEGCAGSDTLFLLSPHSPALGRQQCDAIDAAKRAGVTRIVKLAGMMINPEMLIPSQHVIAEKYLQESGAAWTIKGHSQYRCGMHAGEPEIPPQGLRQFGAGLQSPRKCGLCGKFSATAPCFHPVMGPGGPSLSFQRSGSGSEILA